MTEVNQRKTIIVPADCLDIILDKLNEASAEADEMGALGARDYIIEVMDWLETAEQNQNFHNLIDNLDDAWYAIDNTDTLHMETGLEDAQATIDYICTTLETLDKVKGFYTAIEVMAKEL